jgi:glycosyltransferase involved in cell wall biosynthesis
VQLHLLHNWGGGAARWVDDFCRADRTRQNLVLKPIAAVSGSGTRLALYDHPADARPIACWRLDPPIRSCAATHLGYQEILAEIRHAYGVEAIVVSSLAGHALDALATGLPTAVVLHEYFPFCPALFIVFRRRGQAGPGTFCTSCPPERLADCLAHNAYYRFFDDLSSADVLAIRDRFVTLVQSDSVHVVAPSLCVKRHVAMIEPRMAGVEIRVIPHGMEPLDPPRDNAVPRRHAGRKPTAVVLGRLTHEKGVEILASALPELVRTCDVVLLGCGEPGLALAGPGVKAIPTYDRQRLATLLADLDPGFGLLTSIVPETFSYTLSELMACGIPPVATDRGSFAERIDEGVNGFLFSADAGALLAKVRSLCDRPELLAEVRRNLLRFRPPSLEAMVAQYHELLPVRAPREGVCAPGLSRKGLRRLPVAEAAGQLPADKTFEAAVDELFAIARVKVACSPRLRAWQRPIARVLLAGGYGLVKLGFRLVGRPTKAA